MQSTISQNFPKAIIDGFLIQEMSEPGLEIILGINNREGFGPILMVGFGGIHVEKTRDVAFAPVPLGEDDCNQLLKKLKERTRENGVEEKEKNKSGTNGK